MQTTQPFQASLSEALQTKLTRYQELTGSRHEIFERHLFLFQAATIFFQTIEQQLSEVPCETSADCPGFFHALQEADGLALQRIQRLAETLRPDKSGHQQSFLEIVEDMIYNFEQVDQLTGGRKSLLIRLQAEIVTMLSKAPGEGQAQ